MYRVQQLAEHFSLRRPKLSVLMHRLFDQSTIQEVLLRIKNLQPAPGTAAGIHCLSSSAPTLLLTF